MRTRYKILIVIAITLFVYGVLYLGIISCSSVSECEFLYNFYEYVGIMELHIDVISDVDNEHVGEIVEYRFNNPAYFLFFFVIIPISIIATICYRDRK